MSTTRRLLVSGSAVFKPQHFGCVEPCLSRRPITKASPEIMTCSHKLLSTADHLRKLKPPTSVAAPDSAVTVVDHPWATELASDLVAKVTDAPLTLPKLVSNWRPEKLHIQMRIQKTILDCRFFTLLGVVGTLLGSVLCFVEGCFSVLESYIQYFYLMSQKADQGHVIQLLVEALDMFLIGTAMLIFGVSLHAMFIGSKKQSETRDPTKLPDSNLFGLYYLTKLPAWVELDSVSHAKSKIGHVVMIILQVGVVEKFKSVPLHSGLDLACFSVALLFCSASILLLSRLSPGAGAVRQADLNDLATS